MTRTTAPQPDIASLSRAFINVWLIVSNRSSGSKSGSHKPSATLNSFDEAVPDTTKSVFKVRECQLDWIEVRGIRWEEL